jgi:Xaa-Pro aminopeptidase
MKPEEPTTAELQRHRDVQRLAYRCAEEIGAGLEAGVSEREAARRMRRWLEDAGVDDWLHVPFAWFGDRTAFRGFSTPLAFFPTERRLERGMPFILDCAPVVRGAAADIGYSGALGHNAVVEQIARDLREHRALILDGVRARRPLSEIYADVDRLAARQGFTNRHREYPFHVIGHRLDRLAAGRGRGVVAAFGLRSVRAIARSVVVAARQGWSPLWASGRRSQHAPVPGLWAVEPHLALGGVGAKFEEILVVTETDAWWLDDDLPHVRRWGASRTTEVAA